MKHLSIDELVGQVTPIRALTRKERLIRWADLVRKCDHALQLYHNLEYLNPLQLRSIRVDLSASAFAIAVSDPVFAAEGLPHNASIADIMRFFELTQEQLHKFSCDCGGWLSNEQQANRIERLA